MTVVPSRPTVDTTPRLIASNTQSPDQPDPMTKAFWVQNVTGTAILYLGGDNTVTAGAGSQWNGANGNDLFISLEPGEQLWGVVAAGQPTQTLHVLQQGR